MKTKREIAKLNLVGVQRSGAPRRVAITIGIPYAIRDGSGADCAARSVSSLGLGRHPHLNAQRILREYTFAKRMSRDMYGSLTQALHLSVAAEPLGASSPVRIAAA